MKKLLLTSLFAIGLISFASAQCTPGPEYGNGIYPDTTTNFIFGCKDVAYEQVISIKVPVDTVIDTNINGNNLTLEPEFEYIEINNVLGLPTGLSLACNPVDCKFLGGNVGCAVISGTTSEVGTHVLTFNLTAHLTASIPFVGSIPIEEPYTLEAYKIVIEDCGTSGITEESINLSVNVYPNPATDVVTISNLEEYGIKNIHLINAEGKVVQTYFTEGESVSFYTTNLTPGLYFVKVMQSGGQEVIRLIIE